MKINKLSISILTLLASLNGLFAQNDEYQNNKKEMQHFTYLDMNGEFKMDPKHTTTINDIRNPSRLVLSTPIEKGTNTTIEFYHHSDDKKLIAKCGYKFIGSRPDPYYYPHASKTSIWDIFEKVEDIAGDCSIFKYVISRSPHDTPTHMHLRYGNDVEKLLNMSKDKEDDKFNPWWPEYIGVK